MKLTILGGGSVNTPAFFAALRPGEQLVDRVCLADPSAQAVESVGRYCRAIVRERDLAVDVSWDTDLGSAAAGADLVLNMIRVGGVTAQREDMRRLALSGVTGHAALFPQAIRNLPAVLAAARIVERVAPGAVWVNFSNPVSVLCEALALETRLQVFGICVHSFSLRGTFAQLLGIEAERVRVAYLGLNHLGWVVDVVVDGVSRLAELATIIRRRRLHALNHWFADSRGIPIDHAFCLYHKGDLWYERQKGVRGSIMNVAVRAGLSPPDLARERRGREQLFDAIVSSAPGDLAPFIEAAPWYDRCVLPFIRALVARSQAEFLVTWAHRGTVQSVPGATAESAVVLHPPDVRPAFPDHALPELASAWLVQARASETLLIRAVVERSTELAAAAWAAHPNVVSTRHAQRLASLYFPSEGSR